MVAFFWICHRGAGAVDFARLHLTNGYCNCTELVTFGEARRYDGKS